MTIGISWNNQLSRGELTINHDGLSRDEGMVTLVLICLFTDVRADTDDIIPDNSSDPRGWPGDTFSDYPWGQNSGYWTAKTDGNSQNASGRLCAALHAASFTFRICT
ncbi:phage GP46 family protein [Citrobacter freundii]|uniref:phage GP46 family protein n=1 Tax=Citrobacter freundii TaxID=546 RepID=UPI001FFE0936|nr:phage GP46 family protein [Citrobacter freundii]